MHTYCPELKMYDTGTIWPNLLAHVIVERVVQIELIIFQVFYIVYVNIKSFFYCDLYIRRYVASKKRGGVDTLLYFSC